MKVWLCTASQNGTQNEADFVKHLYPTSTTGQSFRMHEEPPPSRDPQATTGAGGVRQLPLSNQPFDYDCYHQKCLLELQFHLMYWQCPNLLAIVSPTSPRWKATTFHPKGSISKQLVTNSAELASHKLAEQAKSPDKMNHS